MVREVGRQIHLQGGGQFKFASNLVDGRIELGRRLQDSVLGRHRLKDAGFQYASLGRQSQFSPNRQHGELSGVALQAFRCIDNPVPHGEVDLVEWANSLVSFL